MFQRRMVLKIFISVEPENFFGKIISNSRKCYDRINAKFALNEGECHQNWFHCQVKSIYSEHNLHFYPRRSEQN